MNRPAPAPARHLTRLRRRAARVLWAEQILPALAPALALILLWLALALAGAFAPLPGLTRPLLAAATAMFALGLAISALRRVVPPSRASIDHRLERHDWLRPLTTLADRPAGQGASAVWAAHQARALARLSGLRPGPPGLAPKTQALLGLPLLLAALAFALALPHPGARLRASLRPAPALSAPPAPLQAWIVPPAALGLPPIFLDPAGAQSPIRVPRQSRLTLAMHGGTTRPWYRLAGPAHRLTRLDRVDFQASLILSQSGTLIFGRAHHRVTWPLQVLAAAPPTLTLGATQAQARGRRIFLPWTARDRFALRAVGVTIRRQDAPDLPPLRLALPLSGHPSTAAGQYLPDLTANPWAGLPVILRFTATNTAGLTGHSLPIPATLPERHFHNLIARVLAEQRKALVLDPSATATAHANLDRLSEAAAGQIGLGAWLDMRVIAAMLTGPHVSVPAVQEQLWQLALAIEDDGVRAAREALDAARSRLNDALANPHNAAPAQSLQQGSQALQQALKNYLQALARQAEQNSQTLPRQATGKTIDPAQLEQMARQAAEAARAGRTEEARRDLAQLGNILDHLRPGAPKPDATAQNQKPDALAKSLQSLQAGEQALHAGTAARLANPAKASNKARAADAKTQARLRQRLGDLATKLGERGSPIPNGLATADQAMKNARQALATGDDKSAEAAERRAIAGLSASGKEMAQQSQGQGQNKGQGQGQGQTTARNPGQGQGNAQGRQGNNHGRDPLGRAWQQGNGALDLGANANATEATIARARALLQEIRRRASDRARPPAELKYLDRLLGN